MATYVPPKRATELIFYIGLVSQSTGQFQANPTLAAGDVKVSKDGGALNNLTTLPAVTPAASKMVKVTVSSTEMTADNVTLIFSDAAGAEWDDVIVNVQTSANQIDDIVADTNDIQSRLPATLSGDGFMKADLKSIDDELTNAPLATLYLKQLYVENNADDAVIFRAVGGDNRGMRVEGAGSGYGASFTGGPNNGAGIGAMGQGTESGIDALSSGTGKSINAPQDIVLPSGNLDDQLQALPTAAENSTATWSEGTRTLTSFGTLVSDIWSNATRTLTAISDSAGVTTLLTRIASALNIASGKVESNVKQINDTNITGDGSGTPWGPA